MSLSKEVILNAIADEMERAIHNAEAPKGGQHAGSPRGDFWPVGPGVVARFRWWLREIRTSREAMKIDSTTEHSLREAARRLEVVQALSLFETIDALRRDLCEREDQLEKLTKLAKEVKHLRDSGYDGPFIGEVVVPLYTAVRELESLGYKW